MHNKLSVSVALLAIGVAASTACKKSPPDDRGAGTRRLPQDGRGESSSGDTPTTGGHNTTNSLLPNTYWCGQKRLEERMKGPLAAAVGVDKHLVTEFGPILGIADGEKLVRYSVECADDDEITFPGGKKVKAPGGPPLKSTSGWTTGPIALQSDRYDLHTCIATRLNPTGTEIPIWLAGDPIQSDGSTAPPIEEALWITVYDERLQAPTIHIWPLFTPSGGCDLPEAIKLRVCGDKPTQCNLVQHAPGDGLCKQTGPINWKCAPTSGGTEIPAIKTYIGCDAFCSLYPGCGVPAAAAECSNKEQLCPKIPPAPPLSCPL